MLQTIFAVSSVLCAAACVLLAILQWRLWWQIRLYHALLDRIVREAFLARHMPIWLAWSEMTGIRFRIIVETKSKQGE